MMPFPGGFGQADNIALLMSLATAVLYLLMLGQGPSWRLSVLKTLSTSLLAIIAWHMGGPVLLIAGLARWRTWLIFGSGTVTALSSSVAML